MDICYGEVNFLTEEEKSSRPDIVLAIRQEFDFIRFCQAVISPFGTEAKNKLDHFISLSMRKLLFDRTNPLILKICPGFLMPPLTGRLFSCPGEHNEMRLNTIKTNIHIKKHLDWIPFDKWKEQTVSWIDKSEIDVPVVVSDHFYKKLLKGTGYNKLILNCYEQRSVEKDGKNEDVWRMKDPDINRKKVFDFLKQKGYYSLTIQRLIKYTSDTKAAHADNGDAVWISLENTSVDYRQSAISVFATQMIYAATRQIEELKDYWLVEPVLEIL